MGEFRNGAELLNEGFEFDLDFLAGKGDTVTSRDLRKESLYVKFDPFVSDSPRRRTNVGRPSDIIDFSDNRENIKQRLVSLNNDLLVDKTPVRTTKECCLLDMNSSEVDVTEMDGDATVIGNNSVLKDGDQLIEISTFSQTQLNRDIEISNEHTKMKSTYESKFKKYQEHNEHLKSALAKSEDNHFSLYQRSKSMQEQLNKFKKNESLYKESFNKCSEKNAKLVVQFNEMK